MGDYNINLLQHETHSSADRFLNIMISHGLLPSITKASRVTNETASLIDNIFTNVDTSHCKSALLYSDISDHYPVLLQTRANINTRTKNNTFPRPDQCLKRQFNQTSSDNFKNYLLDLTWSSVYDSVDRLDPNTAYDQFLNAFNYGFDKYFPKKKNISTKKPYSAKRMDDIWPG